MNKLLIIGMVFLTQISFSQNRRTTSKTPVSSGSKSSTKTSSKPEVKEESKSSESSSNSNNKKNLLSNDISKFGIKLEAGMMPVNSQNSATLNCYTGQVGLDYNIFKNAFIGLFGQTLFYYQNVDIANIDSKIIDLNSVEYNSLGLNLAYSIPVSKLRIIPNIDISYNFFLAKAIDFELDQKAFLDYRYISLAPKLNLGFQFNESLFMGVYGGYNYQITATKGQLIDAFNPNSIYGGLTTRIGIK